MVLYHTLVVHLTQLYNNMVLVRAAAAAHDTAGNSCTSRSLTGVTIELHCLAARLSVSVVAAAATAGGADQFLVTVCFTVVCCLTGLSQR